MYYSTFDERDIDLIIDNLDTNLYMYRNLINQVGRYDNDKEYLNKLENSFMDHVKLFKHLMPDIPEEETVDEVLDSIKP